MKLMGKLTGEDGKDYPVTIEVGPPEGQRGPIGTTTKLETATTADGRITLRAAVDPPVAGEVKFYRRPAASTEDSTDSWTGYRFNRILGGSDGRTLYEALSPHSVDVEVKAEFVPADEQGYTGSSSAIVLVPAVTNRPTFPEGANTVTINGESFPLAGVDPQNLDYPGGRGDGELIIITDPNTSARNKYGWEAAVGPDGHVLSTGVICTVPRGGYVLSGHEPAVRRGPSAANFVYRNAVMGAKVTVTKRIVLPTPPSVDSRKNNISAWVMLWPDSANFDWGKIPEELNELRLAFHVGTGQRVGDGPWKLAGLKAGLQSFLKDRPDRFISPSLGGEGQYLDLSNWAQFRDNLLRDEEDLGIQFGGLNVDIENPSFPSCAPGIANIMRYFRAERPGFYCSWSPDGSWKEHYATFCQANPDIVDELAFQCYNIKNLSWSTVYSQVLTMFLRGRKLTPSQLGVGMMVEDGRNDRWTVTQCHQNATNARAFGITKLNFWHAGLPRFQHWAEAMGSVNLNR